ncbi:MAG: DUF4384 domain-containing protein [Deltaproteobacteria bacterium]|nr:DUF4384 domain-containing protein [Deltaproteobacteria bacterium]
MTRPEDLHGQRPALEPDAPCGVRLHTLRRHLFEELPPEESKQVRVHVEGCSVCGRRISELRAQAESFAAKVDITVESDAILARLDQQAFPNQAPTHVGARAPAHTETRAHQAAHPQAQAEDRGRGQDRGQDRGRGRGRAIVHGNTLVGGMIRYAHRLESRIALAAFVVIALLVPVGVAYFRAHSESTASDYPPPLVLPNRMKGGPSLEMYVDRPQGPEAAPDGVRLREGDRVQFRYKAAGHGYLFVVSIDARGVISPLYPDHPGTSLAIDATRRKILEGSVILDGAIGPERFLAFFSDQPLSFAVLEARLESILRQGRKAIDAEAPLFSPDENVDVASILIIKEPTK